jgi:hypothetical protein
MGPAVPEQQVHTDLDPGNGSDFPPFDPLYFGFWSITMSQAFNFNLVAG